MDNARAFFEACENGNRRDAKDRRDARDRFMQVDQESLIEKKTPNGRTCLHMAVIFGDPDLFEKLTAKLGDSGLVNIIRITDEKGDTALHLAVREDCVNLVEQLVKLDKSLCDCANKEGETPLKLAVSLGFREAVQILVTHTSNALHYIVELNQVKLVKYLIKISEKSKTLSKERKTELDLSKERKTELDLSKLINQPYQPAPNPPDTENSALNPKEKCPKDSSGEEGKISTDSNAQDDQPIVRRGDRPLHIAARSKHADMVNLLLKVDGVKKLVRNSEGKTPFQIAREVTEYHESFRIIRNLGYDSERRKTFMYCAPQVSHKKYKKARDMVNKAYEDRRNAELVVAALLAAMTCAAAFTVPGGFNSESPVKENGGSPIPSPGPSHTHLDQDQGSPLLISRISFKLFIIFDCIAFFLSLFVCIMWEMSSELTTGDKMLFMTVNSLVVCCSFGFASYGFMAAMHAMLARKVEIFSWVVLGSLIAITACGHIAFIRQSLHFAVTRARFHRLCGVSCFVDDIVKKVWCCAEDCGLLNLVRSCDQFFRDVRAGQVLMKLRSWWPTKNSNSSPSCHV